MDKFCGGPNYEQTKAWNAMNEVKMQNTYQEAADNRCGPTREQTVAEYLDDRIYQAVQVADALRDLKASLPGSFLGSGVSRIAALTLPR